MAKLWRKLKWLVFFWDTVYIAYIQRYTAAQQYIVASLIGSVVYVSR